MLCSYLVKRCPSKDVDGGCEKQRHLEICYLFLRSFRAYAILSCEGLKYCGNYSGLNLVQSALMVGEKIANRSRNCSFHVVAMKNARVGRAGLCETPVQGMQDHLNTRGACSTIQNARAGSTGPLTPHL